MSREMRNIPPSWIVEMASPAMGTRSADRVSQQACAQCTLMNTKELEPQTPTLRIKVQATVSSVLSFWYKNIVASN